MTSVKPQSSWSGGGKSSSCCSNQRAADPSLAHTINFTDECNVPPTVRPKGDEQLLSLFILVVEEGSSRRGKELLYWCGQHSKKDDFLFYMCAATTTTQVKDTITRITETVPMPVQNELGKAAEVDTGA
jgi:hypothetical protein